MRILHSQSTKNIHGNDEQGNQHYINHRLWDTPFHARARYGGA